MESPVASSQWLKLPSARATPYSPLVRCLKSLDRSKLEAFMREGGDRLIETDRDAAARFSSVETDGHDVKPGLWPKDRDGGLPLFKLSASEGDEAIAEFHAVLFDPHLPAEILASAVLYARLLRAVYEAQTAEFRSPGRTLLQPSLLSWVDGEFEKLAAATDLWRTFVERFDHYGTTRGWLLPAKDADDDALRFSGDSELKAAIKGKPVVDPLSTKQRTDDPALRTAKAKITQRRRVTESVTPGHEQ